VCDSNGDHALVGGTADCVVNALECLTVLISKEKEKE
jgi:hypothetical protein